MTKYDENNKYDLEERTAKFGEEIIIELLCDGTVAKAPKRSKYDTVEIYFPKEAGIKFFRDALDKFEGIEKPTGKLF